MASADPPQPAVSAIIPSYNANATLRRALESIMRQTYAHVAQVIVSDDASADNPQHLLGDVFPAVTWLRHERLGEEGNRNAGAQAATGEYLAFLDHDDEWLPDKISRQMVLCREHPEIEMVLTGLVRVDERGHRDCRRCGTQPWVPLRLEHLLDQRLLCRLGLYSTASTWLIKRSLYERLGGLDPRWAGMYDLGLLLRVALAGVPMAYLPEPLVRYHYLDGSLSHALTIPARQELLFRRMELLDEAGERAVAQGLLTAAHHERLRRDRYVYRGLVHLRFGGVGGALELVRRAAKVPQSPWSRLRLTPLLGGLTLLRACAGEEWPMLERWRRRVRPLVWRCRQKGRPPG